MGLGRNSYYVKTLPLKKAPRGFIHHENDAFAGDFGLIRSRLNALARETITELESGWK